MTDEITQLGVSYKLYAFAVYLFSEFQL